MAIRCPLIPVPAMHGRPSRISGEEVNNESISVLMVGSSFQAYIITPHLSLAQPRLVVVMPFLTTARCSQQFVFPLVCLDVERFQFFVQFFKLDLKIEIIGWPLAYANVTAGIETPALCFYILERRDIGETSDVFVLQRREFLFQHRFAVIPKFWFLV